MGTRDRGFLSRRESRERFDEPFLGGRGQVWLPLAVATHRLSLLQRRSLDSLHVAHARLNRDALLRDGLLAFLAVGAAFVLAWWWDGKLSARQEIMENTRFVRQVDIDDARDKPFQALNLEGATLAGLDLGCRREVEGCADFGLALLKDANLAETDLSGANLYRADLSEAGLSRTELTGAYLYEADLTDAVLVNADLSYADLSYAKMQGADLLGANLSGAELMQARLDDVRGGGNWTDADLTGAHLDGAHLHGTVLVRVDLSGAVLAGADLSIANLTGANLTGADLSGADLTRAILEDADLDGVDMSDVKCDQFTRWPEGLSEGAHPECPFD